MIGTKCFPYKKKRTDPGGLGHQSIRVAVLASVPRSWGISGERSCEEAAIVRTGRRGMDLAWAILASILWTGVEDEELGRAGGRQMKKRSGW